MSFAEPSMSPGESPADGTLVEAPRETAGRYRLVDLLGRGAMGEVWRAEDPEIGRAVAVKILTVPAGVPDAETTRWAQRFLQEARAAGRLSHPGIVPIHDVGRTTEGRPFIVMELIEGRSLDAILRGNARIPPATALRWGAEVAEALGSAHAAGVIHRDVKPANILVDSHGRARIADFGIARLSESDLTRTGLFLGSPAYASPEQVRGGALDGRSDLFSLGATLYQILTGVRPFAGEDLASLAYAICHVDPLPPGRHAPGLPPGCDAVVMRSLAKDPAARHATGQEMAADLRGAAAGRPVTARPAGEIQRRAAEAGSRIGAEIGKKAAAAYAEARRLWALGWAEGPRARAAMVIGTILLLAALTWGSALLIHRIQERRETPADKFKDAFKSLFSG